VLKLAAIAALIAIGLSLGGAPAPSAPAAAFNPLAFGGALMPVLFSYGGWYYVNDIAGEVRDPQRTLPRALIFGMLLVAACYLLANLAYLAVLGHDGLAASSAPAADLMPPRVRRARRAPDRSRHRDLDAGLLQHLDDRRRARVPGNGRRRRVLPRRGPPASALALAERGAADARRMGLRARPHRHLRPAAEPTPRSATGSAWPR
jgi:hypothetical protein